LDTRIADDRIQVLYRFELDFGGLRYRLDWMFGLFEVNKLGGKK